MAKQEWDKYRVSQKEVPHFKRLFYKNGIRYKKIILTQEGIYKIVFVIMF